jgi:hypothetical protein
VAASLFGAPKLPPPAGVAPAPVTVPAAPAPVPQAALAPGRPISLPTSPSGEFAAVSPSSIIKDVTPPPVPVSAAFAAPAATSQPRDEEMEHFQQVFEEYIALRARCGEPTASVAAHKFFAKLQSNRDQLIAKYGCRTARFSVYVKDGKAAIKATPVRR